MNHAMQPLQPIESLVRTININEWSMMHFKFYWLIKCLKNKDINVRINLIWWSRLFIHVDLCWCPCPSLIIVYLISIPTLRWYILCIGNIYICNIYYILHREEIRRWKVLFIISQTDKLFRNLVFSPKLETLSRSINVSRMHSS